MRVLSKAQGAAGDMTSTGSFHSSRQARLLLRARRFCTSWSRSVTPHHGRLGATRTMALVAVWCVRRFPGSQPSAWAARGWTGVATWIVSGRHVSPARAGMDRAPICQNGPVLAPYEARRSIPPAASRHLHPHRSCAGIAHGPHVTPRPAPAYPIDDWADTGGMVKLSKSMSATDGDEQPGSGSAQQGR